MEGEDILGEEALVFDPSLWIGCQKKYKDVPLHVSNALTQLRRIPKAVLSLLPRPEVPILDFICHDWSRYVTYCFSSRLFQFVLLVIALYAKTGGKNGKHMAITDSSNISAVSNIGVQVFEHMYSGLFRAIPEATALFFTKRFALLQPISFLCLISSRPTLQPILAT